ncbi:HAO1.2 family protein [Megaselia abdita]
MSEYNSVADYEAKAKTLLESSVKGFYQSGAGDEQTLYLNKQAFQRLRIRPRVLRDVSKISLKNSIFSKQVDLPLGIAPSGMQKVAHDDGESGNARAVGSFGGIYIMSTVATTSIEELAQNAPNTRKWFQLYPYATKGISESLIKRAENAGFEALVITVDVPVLGLRRTDAKNKFVLPKTLQLANLVKEKTNGLEIMDGLSNIASNFNAGFNWEDVRRIVRSTKLPVIIKGILTAEDAFLAKANGCRGIIVSNHGGRQLDGVPAAIEALPEIVEAVGHSIEVMMDGGVSQGTDVFRALALGAKMVFVGRASLWGLTVNGQKGVEDVFRIIKNELEVTMALAGCASIGDIRPSMVKWDSGYYSKL